MGNPDRRTWSQVPFGKKRYASLQSTHGLHRLNGNNGQGREAKELRCSGLVLALLVREEAVPVPGLTPQLVVARTLGSGHFSPIEVPDQSTL